jgi:hypothetical protein
MLHFAIRTMLAAMLGVPFIAISYSEASAQQRATCSQDGYIAARSESAKGGMTPVWRRVAGL